MNDLKTVVIDLPVLRLDWLEEHMQRTAALTKDFWRTNVEPIYPPLTCTAQATLTTGKNPLGHGIYCNGIFDRKTKQPEFWVFHDTEVEAKRIWEEYGEVGLKTGVFFFLNINQAKADTILLPKPIHHDDGSMEMWCYHKPDGLYPELVKDMGHFNLMRFWGPMAGIESSQWIAESSRRAILHGDLDLSFIYLPHTDYAPQKFGPDSDEAKKAHEEVDVVIADLLEALQKRWPELGIVITSEYAITAVDQCEFPNKVLREAGLLNVVERDGREYIDYENSPAFAMVDHQLCHIYCDDEHKKQIVKLFYQNPAVDTIFTNPSDNEPRHAREGEVILAAKRNAWFAYPWWDDFAKAPEWAAKIDIHNKPGYDPLEMWWDAEINGTAQDVERVKGSHGAPPHDEDQQATFISNLHFSEHVGATSDIWKLLSARIDHLRKKD